MFFLYFCKEIFRTFKFYNGNPKVSKQLYSMHFYLAKDEF